MPFIGGVMPVFDRSGARIGDLTGWSVSAARTYKIDEIEDFEFYIPIRDAQGNDLVTAAVWDLLARDNLIYIEDEVLGLPGWGGVIDQVTAGDGRVTVHALGGLSLLTSLETTAISQSGGDSALIAEQFVAAAAAKQGAHGDLVVTFVADGTTPNYGRFTYEGDILRGLQQLASDTLAEFYGQATLSADAQSLAYAVHWHDRFFEDFRSTRTFTDGPDGNLVSGASALFSGLQVINRARMKGSPTNLGAFVDYEAVRNVIVDISPEVDVTLDTSPPNYRRREDLTLTVNFGYSDEQQKVLATAIQDIYISYYKSFLAAFHNRQGKPFLDGYDWGGPDQTNEKLLTESDFHTFQALGLIGETTVITSGSGATDTPGTLDGWVFDSTIQPVTQASGLAISFANTAEHWVADQSSGSLYLLDADWANTTLWQTVATGTEVLMSVATNSADIDTVWVLLIDGSVARIRWYSIGAKTVIGSYDIAAHPDANDIAVDVTAGRLYMVSNDGVGDVEVRNLANGLLLSPDASFPSGFTNPVGLSLSGGIVYVINADGLVRMLYSTTGNLAGTFDTATPASGLLVDQINRLVWVVGSAGDISIFHANVALGVVQAPGGVVGAPGFDSILAGQFVHVVMSKEPKTIVSTTPGTPGSAGTTPYTVKSGDTLWGIAVQFYGNGSSWPTIYNYNKAVIIATAQAHGYTSNYSHWIFPGEHLVIPATGIPVPSTPGTTTTTTVEGQYLVVHTPGHWEATITSGGIGTADTVQQAWVLDADVPIVGFVNAASVALQPSDLVIEGEEGRVSDWDPRQMGYGRLLASATYTTPAGHIFTDGPGWYPADWDVPDGTWTVAQQPWPEGEAYLLDYLKKRNAEVTVQTFHVVNRDNLWADLRRGGVYHYAQTLEGPQPGGLLLDVRVLAFSPNEMTGQCEVVAEVYIP